MTFRGATAGPITVLQGAIAVAAISSVTAALLLDKLSEATFVAIVSLVLGAALGSGATAIGANGTTERVEKAVERATHEHE